MGSSKYMPPNQPHHSWNPDKNATMVEVIQADPNVATVVARGVLGAGNTTQIVLTPPNGAKGALLELSVYTVTGTFTAGQGVSMIARLQSSTGFTCGSIQTTPSDDASTVHLVYFYPGAVKGEIAAASNCTLYAVGLPVSRRISVNLSVTGTFEAGQGIDCALTVHWLF